MGLFSAKFEKEGRGLPLPEGGAGRYFSLLFSQCWKLLGANLLFLFFSLPLISLPAALCALDRVCIVIYRRGSAYVWQEFTEEFRKSLLRRIPASLLFGLLLFLAYYSMSLGLSNTGLPLWCVVFWTVGIMAAFAGLSWGNCYYTLAALMDQKEARLLKNAALLCMLSPGRAMASAALSLAALALTALLLPLSLFLLAILPAIVRYTVCVLVYEQAEVYMENE